MIMKFSLCALLVLSALGCVKEDYFGRSAFKQVLYFHIPGQLGTSRIQGDSLRIYITVPSNMNISRVAPDSIALSTFATIEPGVGSTQNFSLPVSYKVTAEDHSSLLYTVFVKQ